MTACRSCKAEVEFARNLQGKVQIVDAKPSEKGNIELIRNYGMPRCVVWKGDQLEEKRVAGVPLHLDHHATCPEAKQWRR